MFLNKSEYLEFRKSLQEVLEYIDDEIILNNEYIVESIQSLLIYLKNNEFHIEVDSNKVFLKSKDHIINSTDPETNSSQIYIDKELQEYLKNQINN